MWKKIAVITSLSVATLGVGGAAWAEAANTSAANPAAAASSPAAASGTAASSTSAASSGSAVPAKQAGKHHRGARLKRVSHAQWVSKDKKTGGFVTHDAVRGVVSAVSNTSISVKAADGTTETYAVTSSTKVHAKGDSKSHPGTIAQVKKGDAVGVVGTGSSSLTATHIVDRGTPKTSTTTAPTTG